MRFGLHTKREIAVKLVSVQTIQRRFLFYKLYADFITQYQRNFSIYSFY